jgi:hypothetical protein
MELIVSSGQIILIVDAIRDDLERARESDDLDTIRKRLDRALEGISALVGLTKAAARSPEDI